MADLFVKGRGDETLLEFATRTSRILGLSVDRRLSSHYINDEYFVGSSLSVKVRIAEADDPEVEQYRFWIHLEPDRVALESRSAMESVADLLARRLTTEGDVVVRLPNANVVGGGKILYALEEKEPRSGVLPQVVTREE